MRKGARRRDAYRAEAVRGAEKAARLSRRTCCWSLSFGAKIVIEGARTFFPFPLPYGSGPSRIFEEIATQGVKVVDIRCPAQKPTIMRNKGTFDAGFRRSQREISPRLGDEVTRKLELMTTTIETPLETTERRRSKVRSWSSPRCRAWNGLSRGCSTLCRPRDVAHTGLIRVPTRRWRWSKNSFKAPSESADRGPHRRTECWRPPTGDRRDRYKLKGRAHEPPASCACSPRHEEGRALTKAHPTCRCDRLDRTGSSTEKATIVPGWLTR